MTFFEITLISCLKILKIMYVRRRQGEITLLWCLKNTNNLWYLLKSQYDSENVEKNRYFRRCQGIITLLNPKNADNLWYFVEITLLWFPKILREKKNMYVGCRQSKTTLLRCPKNTDKSNFFIKITLLWSPDILQNF